MKIEDIRIGMKVKIPTTKWGKEISHSVVVNRAKKAGQDFLFVNGKDGEIVILNETDQTERNGDYFVANDLTPYSNVLSSKPKIGTQVKISNSLEQKHYANGIVCTPSMLKYQGSIATVVSYNTHGVNLDIDGGHWSWDYDMLESPEIVKYKCIKAFPGVKVGDEVDFDAKQGQDYYSDEYFTPVFENPIPKIEFQGYELNVEGNRVNWGCKSFSKEEIKSVIDFVKVFNEMDLQIGLKHNQDNFDAIEIIKLEQLYKTL
jgi:hypothetical protein